MTENGDFDENYDWGEGIEGHFVGCISRCDCNRSDRASLQAGPLRWVGSSCRLTRSGTTALPTGDYTISIDRSVGSNGAILVYRDGEAVGIVVPQTLDLTKGKARNPHALHSLRSESHGPCVALARRRTFYFPMPKDLKTLVALPHLIEAVSVQMGE